MTRNEFNKEISFCGDVPFAAMYQLIEYLDIPNISVKRVLQEALSVNGKLDSNNWAYLLRNTNYVDNAQVTEDIALGWLQKQCRFTRKQLIEVVENLKFIDGQPPTYLLDGDLILIDA